MEHINKSLFLRLALLILGATGLVFVAMIFLNHQIVRPRLMEKQNQYYSTLASDAAHEISIPFLLASEAVSELASLRKYVVHSKESAGVHIRNMLDAHPNMFGSAIAIAPGENQEDVGFQIVYGYKMDGEYHFGERNNPAADYQSDWFYLPYYLKKPVWTEPYFDPDTHVFMITYSAPVIKEDGSVSAVVTCDLTLDYVQTLLESLDLGKQGVETIISRYGKIIMHPNPEWRMRETLYSLSESSDDPQDRQTLTDISALIRENKSGQHHFKRVGEDDYAWMYFDTVDVAGWLLGFIISEKQILAPVYQMNKIMGLIAIGGILLLLIPAFWVSLNITRPLHDLCQSAEQLSMGNFDTVLPTPKRKDEIGQLVYGFDDMRKKLKEHIKTIAVTTAAKEKIESELSVAREIQHSILPKIFPPFPARTGLDVYAVLESAKEVGGDLYDFLLLDDEHLYVCIGDVSGKGVPASLFMATGKTLLKSTIQTMPDPAQTFAHVNKELADGNDTCMFITAFCGILDLKTNVLTYANAGHNPPLVISGGKAEYLPLAPAPPLAVAEEGEFKNETFKLGSGDKLFLYTDGVTEAMDPINKEYGDIQLSQFLDNNPCETVKESITSVLKDVRRFASGAEQSDDITMLCISHKMD